MAKETSHVGKVLFVDETGIERTVAAYKVINQGVNAVAEAYEALGFGKFTKEALNDLFTNRLKTLKGRYDKEVTDSIERLQIKSPTIRQNMIKQAWNDLNTFSRDKIEPLFSTLINTAGSGLNTGYPIRLEQVTVIDGRAVIDDKMVQWIKEHFTYVITTESQSEVYGLLLELQGTYNKLAKKIPTTGRHYEIIPGALNDNVLIYVDEAKDELCLSPFFTSMVE